MLYNDCWHGLWVRSWCPSVLWQTVMLWLVNRGIVVHQQCVEQVSNRKETTWYENHAVRFRQSAQSESRVELEICSRSEVWGHLWRYGLQEGASVGTHWLQEEDIGQEEVPSLSICLSIYLSKDMGQEEVPSLSICLYLYHSKDMEQEVPSLSVGPSL